MEPRCDASGEVRNIRGPSGSPKRSSSDVVESRPTSPRGGRCWRSTNCGGDPPFGLFISPFVFQACTASAGGLIREATGVQVVGHLDDFRLVHPSKHKLVKTTAHTRLLFHPLGSLLSPKSKLEPTARVKLLGLEWGQERKVCAQQGNGLHTGRESRGC